LGAFFRNGEMPDGASREASFERLRQLGRTAYRLYFGRSYFFTSQLGVGRRKRSTAAAHKRARQALKTRRHLNEKALGVRQIRVIAPDTEKRYLTFHLRLDGSGYEESISVSISWDLLTGLVMSLQQYQASHKLAILSNFRPMGKQSLSIVSDWQASP